MATTSVTPVNISLKTPTVSPTPVLSPVPIVLSPHTTPSPPVLSPHTSTDGICGSDDTSVASSAAAMMRKFKIPDMWRPSIMECIENDTEEQQRQALK